LHKIAERIERAAILSAEEQRRAFKFVRDRLEGGVHRGEDRLAAAVAGIKKDPSPELAVSSLDRAIDARPSDAERS
jgi:hypothetical protein